MKNNALVVVLLIVVAGGGLWYLNRSKSPDALQPSDETQGTSLQVPAPDTTGVSEMVVASDVKEVLVDASEFKFSQDTMTINKGQKVRLTLKNTGKMTHDFVIDELGVKTNIIKGGEEDVVEFTPEKVGTFEYYCSVGEHRAKGMKGMLTVTE